MLFKNGNNINEYFEQQDKFIYKFTDRLNLKYPN